MQAMLPQYHFEKLLGRGGMGAVYKAVQASLDRAVAIKVLPGDLLGDDDAQFAERFKNEARTMAKMSHPSIVNVYDFGETQSGLLYFVMEFIDGTDVSQMIESQGKLPENYALSITAHVCDALAYAHARGVIHRDIKPANILINMEGAVKVADFGLAKQNDAGQAGLTKTNMTMGTPDFVAPEALMPGVPLDGRVDLYAIGVMLYQMLTGEIPRGMWKMPALKVGTDPRFDAIIAKAMQTDREERYLSAVDLRRDLDTILTLPRSVLIQRQQEAAEAAAQATRAQKQAAAPRSVPKPVPAPPPKPKSNLGLVLGIAAVLVLGVAGYVLFPQKKPEPQPRAAAPDTMPPLAVPQKPDDSSRFAGVKFPRDLCQPASTAWRFEGGDLVCANSKGGEFPAFVIPQEVKNGFECEVELSMPPSMAKFAYLKVMFSAPKGWTSMQVFPDNVVTFVNGRQQRPVPLNDNQKHVLKLAYDANARLVILVDGVKHFDTLDEGSPATPQWSGVKPGFVNIGAETKGGPPFKLHAIRLRPAIATPPSPSRVPAAAKPVAAVPPSPALPVPTAAEGWIDLLATADVQRDSLLVPWTLAKGALRSPEEPRSAASPAGHASFAFPISGLPLEYDLHFRVSRNKRGHAIVMPFRRGNEAPSLRIDGGRGFDFFHEPSIRKPGEEWFPPDGVAHDVLIEVREDRVRTSYDGKVLIEREGTLPQGQFDQAFFRSDKIKGPIIGIGVCMGSITVHSAAYRPMDAFADKKAALMAADPYLAKLESGFQARHQSDAQKPYEAALTLLNQSYIVNGLGKARATALAKGAQAEVAALDAEKALIEKGGGVPAEDAAGTPEPLKSVRTTYRTAFAKISSERDAKTASLLDRYVKALDDYIVELTKAGKIDEAKKVQALRNMKATSGKPAPSAAVPPPQADMMIGSEGWTHLGSLKQLQRLELRGKVPDEQLVRRSGLETLEHLTMEFTSAGTGFAGMKTSKKLNILLPQ